MDAELDAMQKVISALEPLEVAVRQRVVNWAMGRFAPDIFLPGKEHPKAANGHDVNDEVTSIEEPSFVSASDTLGEMFSAANPKTNGQRALVVGYWLQTRENLLELDAQRINTELKHLGYGVSNITVAMGELKSSKPALAIQLKKSGSSRQARKKYKVTEAGMKAVEALLRGQEVK